MTALLTAAIVNLLVVLAGAPAYGVDIEGSFQEIEGRNAELAVGLSVESANGQFVAAEKSRRSVTRGRTLVTYVVTPAFSHPDEVPHRCAMPGRADVVGWQYEVVGYESATGIEVSREPVCVPPSDPSDPSSPPRPPEAPVPLTSAEVWDAVAIDPPALSTSPLTRGVTGLETWLWATGPDMATVAVSLDGFVLTGTARRESYRFDFGDGTIVETASGGSEQEPAARHTYERKGTYTLAITSVWRANVVLTGPGITIPLPVDLGRAAMTTTVAYPVIEIVPVLVG